MLDGFNRKIDYVRISVTDRCNFRCVYCMPQEGVDFIEKKEILTYEEIIEICKALVIVGITKVKITGGEPFVRLGVTTLIKEIKALHGISSVTVTTNGYYLEDVIDELEEAKVDGINISLDACQGAYFNKITGKDAFEKVLRGINCAIKSSIPSIKINFVPIQELNMDQILPMVKLVRDLGVTLRFIELMPIGYGRQYTSVTGMQIRQMIEGAYGKLEPLDDKLGNGPADYYKLEGHAGAIGFISAVTEKFCKSCNRIRLTSNGFLKTCLHYNHGIHLKEYLRQGMGQDELVRLIQGEIERKPQKHGFHDQKTEHTENKSMFQIGG